MNSNEPISDKLKAVSKWLHSSKDEIDDAGHEILFVDIDKQDDDRVSASIICSICEEIFEQTVYDILKQRFTLQEDRALFKVYLMQFVHSLQLIYESDYADEDQETIQQSLEMMHTAIDEHADKFHALFEDDDDPNLASDVTHALNTMKEMGTFFGIYDDDDDDYDDFEDDLFDFDEDEDEELETYDE